MNYLIINGSPRKKNTWSVVERVKSNLDGNIEEIQLAKERIPLCNGGHKCVIEGYEKCPHFDKISSILEKFSDADGIIITSPVYSLNVSALLKNLFDHTAFLYHRPKFFTKKALVVVTTAGSGHKPVSKYMDETLRHWGVNKVYKLIFACGGKDILDTKAIDKIALEFKSDVESGKLHSPKFKNILYHQVWRAMAANDNEENHMGLDRKYWNETGLINYDYAPEVNLGIIKKVFAKMMFFVLKRVIK